MSEATSMQIPIQISFHGVDRSEALETDIREHVARLEEFCARITSCHVVIEKPHRHHHHGSVYQVRIHVSVPRRELVVTREPAKDHAHEDPYVTVRDAFKAMRRQLEDYVRKVRGDVKTHAILPHGRVGRLFPELDYGFIETPEGRAVYFHRNSLLNGDFDQLTIGTRVTFTEEEGDKGPQASSVRLIASEHEIESERSQ
jgi:cold shock CspA family protein/ribosome-associated translation inhibitor RaiA